MRGIYNIQMFKLNCDIPMGCYFQDSATGISLALSDLHDRIMVILVMIIVFVCYFIVSFLIKKGDFFMPRLYINDLLEFGWVLVPVIILYSIAIYSIDIMYMMDEIYCPDVSLNITGYQWYWGYSYPDFNVDFESRIMPIVELVKRISEFSPIIDSTASIKLSNLETDLPCLIPVDTNLRLLVTSADVIHSWAMPSWGIKVDAIPGRINSTGINVHREGIFYGQCSELCGILHGFMPIKVSCLTPEQFLKAIYEI